VPLTTQEVLDEIEATIPGFVNAQPKPLQMACVRIAEFLENGGILGPDFLALETAMLAEINLRLAGAALANPVAIGGIFAGRVNVRPIVGGAKLPAHLQGVLSTVLANAETANGLSQVTFTGFVQPTAFRGEVNSGRAFKDPAVPFGHGEFTHRIQWYLVFRRVLAPRVGWGAFYRWVGTMFNPANTAEGLWDILFDRNKVTRAGANGPFNTTAVSDFRSPENLHKHLRHLLVCPVLRGFIEGRHRKRKTQGLIPPNSATNINTDTAMRDYLSRKIFGVPYSQLPLTDRPTLQTQTPNNVLVPAPVKAVSVESGINSMWRSLYNAIGW